MKAALIIFCFCLAPRTVAQTKKEPDPAHFVTVTGCIYKGVECLTLKDTTGNQDYSIAATSKLKVGRPYRITGTVSTMGMCQEGKPILEPQKITKSKLKCDVPAAK